MNNCPLPGLTSEEPRKKEDGPGPRGDSAHDDEGEDGDRHCRVLLTNPLFHHNQRLSVARTYANDILSNGYSSPQAPITSAVTTAICSILW
ncbi:hypothetical protein SK128_021603, partial [Halocaridina rubra]